MGFFDKPQFLTGKENGYVHAGETFWLHNARLDGSTQVAGETREQAKLLVSKEKDGEQVTVFTSGTAIVGQVRRIDTRDLQSMPWECRLDEKPSGKGNPTNVISRASDPPASEQAESAAAF